jgi:hypothetical protein
MVQILIQAEAAKTPKPPDPRKLTPRVRRKYLVEQYAATLNAQNGGCAICGTTKPGSDWVSRFCIDHNHMTGKIRGLLCVSCNTLLGTAKEDPEILRAAISYLESHNVEISGDCI